VAAAEGQVGVLELLLTRDADKEATDPEGLTPLAFAVIRGETRALDLLIKAGADTKTRDKNKRTLLHHASVVKSNVKLVEMLIDCGIDIEAMDKDGIRPIDMAIGHTNEVMVANLLRKGAKLGPTTWAMAKGKPRIA
jgi:ankyrin repeat protein